MINSVDSSQWRCIGQSVTGSSHKRTGLPNQDAVHWQANHQHPDCPNMGVGSPLVLAVSDGHGSPRNFRSDIGAQKAVEIATRVIWEFFVEGQSRVNFSDIKAVKDIAQHLLPQRLVHEWTNAVKEDWQRNPVSNTDAVWDRLLQKEGESAKLAIEKNPEIAYGATLLAVLVTQSFILYLQLGDGDILCVNSQGKTTRPLRRDPRLIANETTSLCLPNAWNEIQVILEPYPDGQPDTMPALILVMTDGYANSYPSEEEFLKIGLDYLQMIQSIGLPRVAQQLHAFLEETSTGGSGDDITLGIIRRIEHHDKDEDIEAMSRLQANTSEIDHKVAQLSSRQNSLMKQTRFSLIVSMVAFLLAITTTFFNFFWFGSRLSALETKHEAQQTALNHLENRVKAIGKGGQGQDNPPGGKISKGASQNEGSKQSGGHR
ncbi:MAG TPA: PP2C family serine/threonine-protein phosphatase [Allocoleopsis sp.]